MTEITTLHDPYFTHKEVVELTGIPDRTLLVWQQRKVFEFFEDAFTSGRGRRLFAPIDVFQVGILYSVIQSTKIPPSTYSGSIRVALSESANQLFSGYWKYLGCSDEEVQQKLVERNSNPLSLILFMRGEFSEHVMVPKSKMKQIYSEQSKDQSLFWAKRPHLSVPFDTMIINLRENMKSKFDVEVQ